MKKECRTFKSLRNRLYSLFLILLTLLVSISVQLNLNSATISYAAQEYPEEILIDIDMAQESIQELLTQNDIFALVYLCNEIELKSKSDANSDTIVTLECGQPVQITGVSQDESYYIWYQVKAEFSDSVYEGYILRDYLAYSDENLLNWELNNIMSLSFSLFSLQPSSVEEDESAPTIPKDIKAFPISYQEALLTLKSEHPNWIFVPMHTHIDWNRAVTAENRNAKSLISSDNNSCLLNGSYDSSWSYPTNGTLAYYMDPRNFLSENYIFQFEFLNYNESYHTESSVQSILNGTFMNGAIEDDTNNFTYAQAFCDIAAKLNVSPFHLASRVRQEQGIEGTSALISGTHETYPGVYNYFNLGATGQGAKENIETGLKKATEYGWTSRYASLLGGANIISKNYIRTGQNTLYLQKFNVNRNSSYNLFEHQYMQNIVAPSSEAFSIKQAYATAGSLENPFVFSIPVYDNMPQKACPKPQNAKELLLGQNSYALKADETVQLSFCLDGLVTDSSSITISSSAPDVASVSSKGTITAGKAGTTTITCTAENAVATCTVTVTKAVPSVSTPVFKEVTYAPEQTLADITLPEGWTWDNPSITPTVENAGYPATYTPVDTDKYELVQSTLSLTVQKGTPTYQVPENLETVEGNVLASLKLPAGFAWSDATTILSKTDSYPASYNPDEANYETVTNILIPVTVHPQIVECTEHIYGEWIITTESLCEKAGEQEHYCNLCSNKETSPLPALEHKYSSTITKEATEAETGIRTFTCQLCKDSYTETIAKLPVSHKHSYTEKITLEASCEKTGIKTYFCSCEDSYTEEIPALKHNYSSEITKAPSEDAEGIRTYTCANCKNSYTEPIAKLQESHKHSYTEAITKQATCLEKGLKTFTCSCKDSYTEEIKELGHDIDDNKCRRCGYTVPQKEDTTVIPPSSNTSGPDNSDTPNSTTPNLSTPNSNTTTVTPSTTNTDTNSTNTSANNSSVENSNAAVTEVPTLNTNDNVVNNVANNTTPPQNNASATPSPEAESDKDKEPTQLVATLNMKNNTVLYEETLSTIRGRDVDVVLQMNEQIRWTIDGTNIVSDEANGIDMGVTVNTDAIPKKIMQQATKLSETGNVIELSLAHDGPMEFKPVLTIDTNRANAGRMATLFYYNPEFDELEFVDEVLIAEDGSISFTFDHASDYAVIISESSLSPYGTITATGPITGNAEQTEDTPITLEAPSKKDEVLSSEKVTTEFSPIKLIIIVALLILFITTGIILILVFSKKDSSPDWEEEPFDDDGDDYVDPVT